MAITTIGTVTGKWNAAGEHDWIKLNLSANTLYSLTVSGSASPSLTLHDSTGNVLQLADATGKSLGFMSATGGSYYLDIADSARSTASYSLTMASVDDDYRNNVSTTGAVAVGSTTSGSWNVAGDHDWLKLSLEANTLYAIKLTGGSSSTLLMMYDSSGNPIFTIDSMGMLGNSGFMPTAAGIYYVDAADYGGRTGAYSVSVTASTDDYRSNITSSGTLAVGGSINGTWNVAGDHDWVKVNLTANTLYSMKATGGTYSVLYVVDANGKPVNGSDGAGQILGYMPATSGNYFIDVSELSGATGGYSLSLAQVADDYANNVSTIGALAVGGAVTGVLNTIGEHDWIKVGLNANTLYSIKSTGVSAASLTMVDASGKEVIAADAKGDTLGFMPSTSGTYYVDIYDLPGLTGSYGLSAATVADDYWSNLATTGAISVGGTATGVLNTTGDHDWFKVSLTANTLYAASVTGIQGPSLAVYDSTGTALTTMDAKGESLGYMPALSGTYYIDVASSLAAGFGNYTLSLTTPADDYRNNVSTLAALGSSTGGGNSATTGNDALSGTSGNDTINGLAGTDTAIYTGKITDYYIKYNRALGTATITDHRTSGDGTDSLVSIEKLQFSDKTFELLNPPRTESASFGKSQSFLFDPSFYLLKNPDLVPTVTLATAFDNYKSKGAAAGAAPNAWFDPVYYANKWADLKALNLDAATLFAHYNLYGVWEGRSAGPIFDKFDGTKYLKDNADVAGYVDAYVADFLGSRSNGAIAHYVIYGANEGRLAYDTSGVVIEQAILIGTPG